jgi:peptidoglycan lytic transglycosylase
MLRRAVSGSRARSALLATAFLVAAAGCSLPPLSGMPAGSRQQGHYVETGTASWYGPGFTGNRTSSGEVYNVSDMTAAHQTLPLGTRIVVTNLDNGRSVEVRVNDRGPFAKGRILDLSYGAARELGLVGPGTARVRVESIDDGNGPPGVVAYAVQAGAFQDGAKAVAMRSDLSNRFDDVYVSPLRTTDALFYRVRIGPFERRDDALVRARSLSSRGVPAMIVEEVRR